MILQKKHNNQMFNLQSGFMNSPFFNVNDIDYNCCVYNSLYLSGLFDKLALSNFNSDNTHKHEWISAFEKVKRDNEINNVIQGNDEIADSIHVTRVKLMNLKKCIPVPTMDAIDYIKQGYPTYDAYIYKCSHNTRNGRMSSVDCKFEYDSFKKSLDTLKPNSNSILILSFSDELHHMVVLHRDTKEKYYIIDVVTKKILYDIDEYFKAFKILQIFLFSDVNVLVGGLKPIKKRRRTKRNRL